MAKETYESMIRWNSKDSSRLQSAIDHFNRELQKVENKENLPQRAKYDDLRDRIISRRELESTINSLNSANAMNLSSQEELASGERVSTWEYQDTIRRKNLAGENLLNELDEINRKRAESGNNLKMGEERVSEIQSTLALLDNSLDDLDSFKKTKNKLNIYGREDIDLYKKKLFMDNFKTAVQGLQNFEHYDLLKKRMGELRNPAKFYEVMKKSDILMDIFLWYKNPDGALIYGGFEDNEEAFDTALENDLGIKIQE